MVRGCIDNGFRSILNQGPPNDGSFFCPQNAPIQNAIEIIEETSGHRGSNQMINPPIPDDSQSEKETPPPPKHIPDAIHAPA